MTTKVLSLFNLNRRGSGANLNLFRSVAMVFVLLLGVSDAWASKTYYSTMNVAVASGQTGYGTVYVNAAGTTSQTKNSSSTDSSVSHSYNIYATANAGYRFSSWSGSGITFGSTTTANTTGSISTSSTSSPGTSKTATASFVAIQATAAPANVNIAAEDPSTTYPVSTDERTLTFTTTTSNALTDFTYAPANGASGKYTFANWRRVDATHVAVDYTFAGGGNYGGLTRTHVVDVTLKGKEHATTQKCTITATFPNAKIIDGSADEVFATYKSTDATQAGVEKTAVFDVEYVDGTNNFDTPTFTGAGASHFTYNSMSYADGKLTVNYTYNGNKEAGTHVATLTLKVNNAIGGMDATYGSKAITITAHNEEEATDDVSVTTAANVTTNYATFAAGLAAANASSGCTLKLLRNVDLGTITATNNITKAMTIDLNGKELRAAVNATSIGVLTITKAVAVTIKDSKTGGKIINEIARNSEIRTIFVNCAGATLTLESGTIAVNNTMQYRYGTTDYTDGVANVTSCAARAIHQIAGTTVNINGGRVQSKASRNGYGIIQASSAATQRAGTSVLNMTGGEIYSECSNRAYGVAAYGVFNLSGGIIKVKLNTETVNANTVYATNKPTDADYVIHNYAFGIRMYGGASVTATSNYYGVLNMTGGKVEVINENVHATATTALNSYGIYFDAGAVNVKTGTASDGTYSQKWASIGNISGGSINVSNAGTTAYGIWLIGAYNSHDNSHTVTQIKNCKIDVSAYQSAYGIYATAIVGTTSNNANPNMGACYAGDVELTNTEINATTTTGTTAYALFAHAVVGNVYKNATMTKATANGYTQVYDGEFGSAAKITVNSGTYTATSATTTAYAVGSTTRAKTTLSSKTSVAAERELGGNAEAYPVLILHGGTFRGETGTTTSGAVLSGGYTTIDGGTYTAYSGTTTSRGIYATAGTLDVSNVEISASGTTTAYGIDLSCGISDYTGFKYFADATLKNLTVTATTRTGNEADAVLMEVTKRPLSTTTYNALSSSNKTNYGAIYQYGEYAVGAKCSIIGGTYTATAQGANAFGVSVNSASLCEDVNGDGVLAIGEGDLSISNAKFTVSTKTGATAYGVWAGGKTAVENTNFTITSATSDAYGLRAYYGKSTIKNSTFDVTATTATAVGLRAEARMSTVNTSNSLHTTNFSGVEGYELVGEIESEGNTVTVKANGGNTAYGIQVISAKGSGTKTTADAGLAFKGDHACAGNAVINGGKYTATASGTTAYAIIVSAPATQGAETAIPSCTVNDGKFYGYATGGTYADLSPAGEPGYFVLNGGYYVKDENIDVKLGEGMNKVAVKSGTPEYTEGYRWRVTDNMTGEIVCKVYNSSNSLLKSYQTLEEALAYVNLPANGSTAMTIVMCGNYTLSKGDYSLPNGKTLLVPYKASGTGKGATQAVGTSYVWVNYDTKFIKPTPLYKLTFASGVNMTVESGAAIEASSVIYITNGASGQGASLLVEGTGIVHDKYGWIDLEEGSHIDLESGSNLYVWGYITGKGEINAKNGSKIYEDFQMGDWRGGTIEVAVQGNKNGMNSKGVFPITHYYYQNIECPITYRAGATAYALGGTAVNALGATNAITDPAVQFIGTSNSMFLMDPATAGQDTWVRKEYDPTTDYVNWTLNSGASIGSISLKMSALGMNINLNSSDYVLPITSNFNIIANYGQVEISNDVCFIPGSKLTIKKEATVIIPSGKRVYFYDQDDWKSYSGYWFNPGYSPSWKTNPRRVLGANTSIKMPDAAVLVEGVLDIRGYAYTTAGGANIYSTRENAGKVKFTAAAPASTAAVAEFTGKNGTTTTLCQLIKAPDSTPTYEGKALNAPWLKNEDGAFSHTTGTTTNKTWIYMEDDDHVYRWILSYEDGCFTYKNNGGGEKQLIHPSDWVAAVANANGDHAYHSEDGTRMFVNAKAATSNAGCVWWEVDPTPEVIGGTTYYVANNENFDNFGTYFYWNNGTSYWVPKKITVTWNNWDDSKLTNGTYGDEYSFNTSPVYQGTNPTRANTTTEKYDWIGWRDPDGNIYDKNATLPRATEPITYTAYFVATKYQHTITFKNKNDNKVIWSGLMDAGTIPVCPVAPTQDPTVALVYTFTNWEGYAANADLPTVTEPATYTAIYSSVPRQYHVTFYNYDAATVLFETDVDYNTTRPVYGGVTPFRSNTSAYSYEWTGWQQGATHYGTTDNLALVTGDVYYVATFSQTDLKYQVLFKRQDGSIIDAPFFNFEETPAAFPANPTLASTVSTDYTFDHWDPATLTPVTEDGKVYTAYFSGSPRQYTAHFVNYDGASLNVDQTIDYNTVPTFTGATPFKPNDTRNSYEFAGWAWEAGDGWEAGSIGIGEAFPAIKGDITFTAQFTPVLLQFNVIYQREDGTFIKQDKVKWGQNTEAPAAADCNYDDEQYTYTLYGWSPATIVNPVTIDAIYTAQYTTTPKSYSVTLNTNGGTINAGNVTSYTYGTGATLPTNVTRTGYGFSGWYDNSGLTGSAVMNISATATGNKTYWAKWTVHTHKFAWDFAGGSTSSTTHTPANNALAYGSAISYPANNTMTKTGYTFAGWSSSAATMPDGDLTITANWTPKQYTITFDSKGGSEVASITQNYGTEITPPANPTRTGYTFAGWDPAVPATMPVDGETCVAQWTINSYQVKFVDEDGTTNLGSYPQTLDYGTAVTAPEEPTKAADATNVYTFAGWSDGVSTYASADIPAVSGAVTYTATYNSAPTVASVTVGGATTYYATLQAAFDYAANKTTPTIKVLKAVSSSPKLTYTNSSNTTVTFDLNGYKVAGGANPLLYITGNNSGKFIIKDGSAGQTGQLYNKLSANGARACVHVHNCPTEFQSGTIYMENTSTSSSVAAYGVNVRSSRKFDMTGGTIKVVSKKSAQGIYTAGTTTISNGTIDVTETANGTAYGVHVITGTTTINGNVEDPTYPKVSVTATKGPRGVIVGGLKPALNSAQTSVSQYNGKLYVNGGTYTVTASADGTTAYGVYAYRDTYALNYSDNATCPGNYVSAGTATITAGDFTVTASGADATAYGVCIQSATSIQTALQEDGTTKYAKKTATPKGSVSGGKFIVSGATQSAVSTGAAKTAFDVQGGWYNIETGLATYTAPAVEGNYRVLDLTGEDPYLYEVAEAYKVSWDATTNGGTCATPYTVVKKGNTIGTAVDPLPEATKENYSFDGWYTTYTGGGNQVTTSSIINAAMFAYARFTPNTYNIIYKDQGDAAFSGSNLASLPATHTYGTATALVNGTKENYTFDGWFANPECTGEPITSLGATAYTADIILYAKWTLAAEDRELDIVDWTNSSITINVINLKTKDNKTNWAIRVNDVDYTKSNCNTTTRTLTVTGLTLEADENLLIQVKNGSGIVESYHNYTIPHLYNSANATLSGTTSSSVVYVYGGKLTISGNTTLAALYVCPGAEVEVTDGTLTVGKLVLRTKPWATAAISGNVEATNIYYTRIAPDGSDAYPTGQYYQFGLPYECAISNVRLSDGTTPAYSTTWLLKSYNEERRAASGTSTNNWDALASDATIAAGRGYEMFSSYKYYREYYFPVTPTKNTSVAVTRHGEDKNNSGWNIVCSPLMSVYENPSDPVDGLKVSWLLADGSYDQAWPETIWPAMPFSYQASANGSLDFSKDNFNQAVSAPRRAAYKENIQTEWLHLDVKDGNGVGDHTSVFVHPDRFEATYQTGIDVAKQSFTASRALIYSSHAYGEMAFAGVADSLLEQGVALTVYSPCAQELTFSMRGNDWLNRMRYVWLVDHETGARTDLLWDTYTFEATEGTARGRFTIEGVFRTPQITTDIENAEMMNDEMMKVRKVLINQKMYILRGDQMYDATGKKVSK